MAHLPIDPTPGKRLRWYQGLERYCWVVLIIAALGWLFDTMDQNLFTLVRSPSVTALMRPHVHGNQLPPAKAEEVRAATVKKYLAEHKLAAAAPADAPAIETAVAKAQDESALKAAVSLY